MLPFRRGAPSREPLTLPLFPLKTVLFPGGMLPLKVFEQRYIDMTKRCLKDDQPFGVCLLTRGEEVARRGAAGAAGVRADRHAGTHHVVGHAPARHPAAQDRGRHAIPGAIASHGRRRPRSGAGRRSILPEPQVALPEIHQPLANLLELMINRVGREHFAGEPALDDASWVGYRLAELLPLPATIKQSMLEINDSEVRLKAIAQFLSSRICCRRRPRRAPVVRSMPAAIICDRAASAGMHHGRPQQVGEHQAQEGRHRRQARQDLHAPDPRNHRLLEARRRRRLDQSAAATRGRQGDGQQHAEGHDRARDQARLGRRRRCEL